MIQRQTQLVRNGSAQTDGAGVHLVRVIGHADTALFDPFLMLDAFDSVDPEDYVKGFPSHPHRGIETVTYLLNGKIEHGDSLGNKGTIVDGGCQWMTAGSGIIHQEMPMAAPRMLGLQLWLNLGAKDKMTKPRYRDIVREKIPAASGEGYKISVIAGAFGDTAGAMQGDYVDADMLDISLEPGASCRIPTPAGNTVFAYVFSGAFSFDGGPKPAFVPHHRAVLLTDGDYAILTAGLGGPARCVLFSGAPLKESIAWGGPIVMNTREELDTAFRELDEGTFIK